jgi:hypothetical protein
MTLQISVSNVKSKDADDHNKFHRVSVSNFSDLASIITQDAWSPTIWKNNYRKIKGLNNFDSCNLIVLDYDEGDPTLLKMIETIKKLNLRHIIGTSKNHQKPKECGKEKKIITCDRFRVIIPIQKPMPANEKQFKWIMQYMMFLWGKADKKCKDQARFFFPCAEIVSMSDGGIFKYPTPPTIEQLNFKQDMRSKRSVQEVKVYGRFPDYIKDFLSRGICNERRPMCFHTAAYLDRCEYPKLEIERRVLNAPFNKSDLDMDDLKRQINNGIEANL